MDVIDSEAHKILDTLNKGTKTEENMQNDFGNVRNVHHVMWHSNWVHAGTATRFLLGAIYSSM